MTDSTDLAFRLAAIEDRLAIADLYARYLWLVDNREWEEIATEIFAPEGELSFGAAGTARGPAEIGEVFAREMSRLEGTAHYLTNLVVEFPSPGRATSRSYIQSFHWGRRRDAEASRPADFVGVGVYRDELVERDGRWWVVARRRSNLGPSPVGLGSPPRDFDLDDMAPGSSR